MDWIKRLFRQPSSDDTDSSDELDASEQSALETARRMLPEETRIFKSDSLRCYVIRDTLDDALEEDFRDTIVVYGDSSLEAVQAFWDEVHKQHRASFPPVEGLAVVRVENAVHRIRLRKWQDLVDGESGNPKLDPTPSSPPATTSASERKELIDRLRRVQQAARHQLLNQS